MTSDTIFKRKVAWGITGSGDNIDEILKVMKEADVEYGDVEIRVYVSRAGEQVLKMYSIFTDLQNNFTRVRVEKNSNTPFLAAWMQVRKYSLLIIAPATSNTVAKIANGIGDTLLTNATIMGLKAFVPVYVVPTDYKEGIVFTRLPNGKEMKLRVRKEEADQVRKLEKMEDMHVLQGPQEIKKLFKEKFC